MIYQYLCIYIFTLSVVIEQFLVFELYKYNLQK